MRKCLFVIFLFSSSLSIQASSYRCSQYGSNNTVLFNIPWDMKYSVVELDSQGETVRIIADKTICADVPVTDCEFSLGRIKEEDVSFSYLCYSGTSRIAQTIDISRSSYYPSKLVISLRCSNITTSSHILDIRYPSNRFEKCSKVD